MSYLIISNGVGKKPHIEEVESIDEVTTRVEQDSDAFVIIEGRIIDYRKESYVFIDSGDEKLRKLSNEQETADDGKHIPRWRAPVTGAAQHIPAVEENPGGETDDTPGDSADKGSEQGGAGADSDSSTDNDGKSE